MIELRLFLHEDPAAAHRLRRLLEREGLRIAEEPRPGAPAEVLVASDTDLTAPAPAEVLEQRLEELERTIRELRNLDVAKSQFLANVSHELRTPLTAIVTYGEILRDGLLGDVNQRQQEAVQSVINSSRQLLSMIEEVLTYARTNSAAIELKTAEFDVEDVIRTVYQMNASLIKQKALRYEARITPDAPRAWGDRDKVVHVLGNLVGNAIEFTPPGGLLHLEARRSPRNPSWLEVLVEDSGIGIDPAHHELIFREFAQVDASRARRHHGTGLGLAIARNFIQLHGGEIWVESQLGRGSRFFFTLPSVEVGSPRPEAAPAGVA